MILFVCVLFFVILTLCWWLFADAGLLNTFALLLMPVLSCVMVLTCLDKAWLAIPIVASSYFAGLMIDHILNGDKIE